MTALSGRYLAMICLVLTSCGGGGNPSIPPPSPPVITSAGPVGPVGLPGSQAEFVATATGDPTAWSWTFGAGVVPEISSNPSPQVLLARPGEYTAEVKASNGIGESLALPFSFTIPQPAQGVWRQTLYDTDLDSAFGFEDLSVIHQGRLVILFQKSNVGYFAAVSEPISSSGDPKFQPVYQLPTFTNPVSLLSAKDGALYFVAAVVDATPYVNLRYQLLHTLDENPQSLADWSISVFESAPGDARNAAVQKMETGWLIAAHTGARMSPITDITVYRTTLDMPTGPVDWFSYVAETDSQGFGSNPRFLSLQDRSWLSYGGSYGDPLRVAVAEVADPLSASDWKSHIVVPAVDYSDLSICQGRLVAAWARGDGSTALGPGEIHLSSAMVDYPRNADDWEITTVKEFGFNPTAVSKAFHLSLSIAHGRLLLAYRGVGPGYQDPYLLRATAVFPRGPEDWDLRLLAEQQSASSAGAPFFAHEVNGRIATAFSSPELFFAQLSDGPW